MDTNVTLDEILALPELQECCLLCSDVDCVRMIRSITIMDNPNILYWLSKYEILLSNGSSMVDFSIAQWCSFLSALQEKETPALFIKLSYFIASLPDQVIAHSRRIGLPIVVVPNSYSWIKISDPIQRFMINRQSYYMLESIRLGNKLNALLLGGGCIADLCNAAADEIGHAVAVYTSEWNLLGSSGNAPWKEASFALKRNRPHMKSKATPLDHQAPCYSLQISNTEIHFFKLLERKGRYYAAFWMQPSACQQLELFKIEQINIVLMLCLHKEMELKKIEVHYYVNFLTDLINGTLSDRATITQRASLLGCRLYDAYQLVVSDLTDSPEKEYLRKLIVAVHDEESRLCDTLVCYWQNRLVLFVPFLCHEDRALISRACKYAKRCFGMDAAQYGVSSPQRIEEIAKAYSEASFALSLEKIFPDKVIYYEDLYLLRLFEANAKKVDVAFLFQYYENTMGKLITFDEENKTNLVETLQTFLFNDRSMSVAARKLFLHENTLRARIKRIETITSRSLKSSMDIVELTVGILIDKVVRCPGTKPFSKGD